MEFKPTNYRLKNVGSGRIFDDTGWLLSDPLDSTPSLIRAVYENKQFVPREDLPGLYRYANWLPIHRILKHSGAPITYKSEGLAGMLGLENLFITFSGYWPEKGAVMETCSFKETEAYSVCARMTGTEDRILVVQSAGNTARAFARVCSDNDIPLIICIPLDCIYDMWFTRKLKNHVKIVATPHGTDYYDAIKLGEKLCTDPRFVIEGGAKNVARRDGMGTTILSAAEVMKRIPDAYFQAVGSGTGAIAAYENCERLAADGRFGENNMRIYAAQNAPFTIMYDSWKADSDRLLDFDADRARLDALIILASVLSNRKPPYALKGGLYDVLKASGGDMYKITNDEIVYWMLQFFNTEGVDIMPAAAVAVASLYKAVEEGKVRKDEYIMLNITGGGMLNATNKGFYHMKAELVVDPGLPAGDVVKKISAIL